MVNYFLTSILSGLVFGFLDGAINANVYARKLFEVYKPIAKTEVNVPLGLAIDLVYGLVMTGLFMVLYQSLPGQVGWVKGLAFGLMVWFFRVLMYVLSQLMMFEVPLGTLVYIGLTGLVEMLIVGLLIGLVLKV